MQSEDNPNLLRVFVRDEDGALEFHELDEASPEQVADVATLWPEFTWSFGCTGVLARAEARRAMTSLAFMFVNVPEPVWKMSTGK